MSGQLEILATVDIISSRFPLSLINKRTIKPVVVLRQPYTVTMFGCGFIIGLYYFTRRIEY